MSAIPTPAPKASAFSKRLGPKRSQICNVGHLISCAALLFAPVTSRDDWLYMHRAWNGDEGSGGENMEEPATNTAEMCAAAGEKTSSLAFIELGD
ncbi:hypothetical protein OF83DRAFT_1173389 [Amylostereum chailletii]|nr:hypothetical protein OF83DRAFT_1173389 [Amylostereum chailletii]